MISTFQNTLKEHIKIVFFLVLFTYEFTSASSLDQEPRSFTFHLADLEPELQDPYLVNAEYLIRQNLGIEGRFEDHSYRGDNSSNFTYNILPGFIGALHQAYQSHYHLKLSVSDFIILIGQGLSRHITNNSEELRHFFANHNGKEQIKVFRDEFRIGIQNDWSTVFGEFATQIRERVNMDIYDVIVDDTSVATQTSRIASEITLMDAMQNYFEYIVLSRCGIPQITLEGTKEDWALLKQKVRKLQEMNSDNRLQLDWWLERLVPVVDKICDTVITGEVDKEFWRQIYKYESVGSGNAYVSGWITNFLPYIKDGENDFSTAGIGTDQLPLQISEVPFIWKIGGQNINMNFHGGFLGVKYDSSDKSVQSAHFWSVTYDRNADIQVFQATE